MRVVSFDEYLDTPRPQVNWVVDQLIPRPGFILLLGPPKAGKSFLALDLAFKIATGSTFLGRSTSPQRVLYFQLDTSERVWRDRGLRLRQHGMDLTSTNVGVVAPECDVRPANILTPTGFAYFRAALSTYDPAVVIVDTLREVHTEDENDSTSMKKVFDALETLFGGHAVILVHHTNKFSPEIENPDPVRAARGSSYITGKVDAFWLLHNHKLQIDCRFAEKFSTRAIQGPSGLFTFPDVQSPQAQLDKLKKLLNDNPHIQTRPGQIALAVSAGMSRVFALDALTKLHSSDTADGDTSPQVPHTSTVSAEDTQASTVS